MNLDPKPAKTLTVSLAVLTFRRPRELQRAVESMVEAAAAGNPSRWRLDEILVIDNNPDASARPVVDRLQADHGDLIRYSHEPAGGIVAGRNRALDEAAGDVLVFIDDDEVALPGWPDGLIDVMIETGAAMVGGPVLFEFIEPPEQWVLDSGFFSQQSKPDRASLTWLNTGNVAIDLGRIRAAGLRFDARYPHGEDAMFSLDAVAKGLDLRWSAEAAVKEYVPVERTTLDWRLTRQRISTNAWVRAELDLSPTPSTTAVLVAKNTWRSIQGLWTLLLGTLSRQRATRYVGLALLWQSRGGFEGIVAHRRNHR